MMASFLPKKINVVFLILLLFLFLIGAWTLWSMVAIAYGVLLFLFRKLKIPFHKGDSLSKGVLFAPVNGKILSIKKRVSHPVFGENLSMIRMAIPWWSEYGFYLPCSLEVKDVVFLKQEDSFRYKFKINRVFEDSNDPNGLCLTMTTKDKNDIGFQFIKCSLGKGAELAIMPGDRGKARSNIGFFPFGGTVLFYLPENYKIMVSKGEALIAGVTLIGGE